MGHLSLEEIWASMSFVARIVFFLLVLLSVFSLTVSIERYLFFRKARRQSRKFAQLVSQYLQKDQTESAIEAGQGLKHSHLAKVVTAGLLKFHSKQQSRLHWPDLIQGVRNAIDRAIFTTTAELKRGISGLATVASVAPFIGLFGTVIGIINAFTTISEKGAGGIGAVSGGIAEALIVTAIGLAVAIPALALFNYFNTAIERFQMEMSNASSELIDFFNERHGEAQA